MYFDRLITVNGMQTELFKKNAIILLADDMQQMLYKDILSASGYIVKVANSASELVELINRDINLILIYLDILDDSSIRSISRKISDFSSNISLVGLAINIHHVDMDNIKIIQLPVLIDKLLDEIAQTEEMQGEELCESII